MAGKIASLTYCHPYLFTKFRIAKPTYLFNLELPIHYTQCQVMFFIYRLTDTHEGPIFLNHLGLQNVPFVCFLESLSFRCQHYRFHNYLIFGGGSIPLSHLTMLPGDRNIIFLIHKMQSVFLLFLYLYSSFSIFVFVFSNLVFVWCHLSLLPGDRNIISLIHKMHLRDIGNV